MTPKQRRYSIGPFRKAHTNVCIFTKRLMSLHRLQTILDKLSQPDNTSEEKHALLDEIIRITRKLNKRNTFS